MNFALQKLLSDKTKLTVDCELRVNGCKPFKLLCSVRLSASESVQFNISLDT